MENDSLRKVEIIAEIANAHQGSEETANKLVEAAVESSADAVKFQIYYADELLVKKHPRYEHFKKQAFSGTQWGSILKKAKKIGKLKIYADVFGINALDTALQYELDGFKVHSTDLCNIHLIERLAITPNKIFLSAGGSSFREIIYAVKILSEKKSPSEIILLHGFQAYPTKIENSCINRIGELKRIFGSKVTYGYMDHLSGDDKFTMVLPLLTLCYGVSYIEKHITLNRSEKGIDYYSSLNPDEFSQFVKDVRAVESAFSGKPDQFSDEERKYRNKMKKVWVAKRDMQIGKIIKETDFEMKRSAEEKETADIKQYIGKNLIKELKEEEPLSGLHIDHKVLAVIVARMNSRRLPRKAVLIINDKPAISHLFERVTLAMSKGYIDKVAFCTTQEKEDDELVEIAKAYHFNIYRGDSENVLSRMMLAINDNPDCDIVLRITGDDILVDPEYLVKTVECHLKNNADYTDAKKLPSGTEVEAFNSDTLRLLFNLSQDSSGTEYLTNYIRDNWEQFKTASLEVNEEYVKKYRLTLDTKDDYLVIAKLLEHMKKIGKEIDYGLYDINEFFKTHPELLKINTCSSQKKESLHIVTRLNWSKLL